MVLLGRMLSERPSTPRRHTGAEGPAPNDNGAQEPRSRQGVDVLLDVSELDVDRINLEVKDLMAPPTEPGSAAPIPGPATAGDSRLSRAPHF